MSWARLDDSFTDHPKIRALTDREFRVHVEAICYAARFRTEGVIPDSVHKTIGATPAVRRRLCELGVWENGDQELRIHDFEVYNPKDPTAADRQRRRRRSSEEPKLP